MNAGGSQRVRSRLGVSNLHPYWAQLIDFGSITQFLLLDGPLSVFLFRRHSDPALRLRYDLVHFLRLAIRVTVHHILVMRLVEDPQEIWRLLLQFGLIAAVQFVAPTRQCCVILKHPIDIVTRLNFLGSFELILGMLAHRKLQ